MNDTFKLIKQRLSESGMEPNIYEHLSEIFNKILLSSNKGNLLEEIESISHLIKDTRLTIKQPPNSDQLNNQPKQHPLQECINAFISLLKKVSLERLLLGGEKATERIYA